MKRFLTVVAVCLLALTAYAQPQGRGQNGPEGRPGFGQQFEQRDPAQIAQEQTDRLDKLVQLTPKQYKKIYKFNKRQSEQLKREMENMMPQGRPEGFPGGMGPGGMGPGGPGGRPRGNGEFRPGPRGGAMQELMEEQQQKRVKKYYKILTEEQFQKWQSFEEQREFRQIIENN